MSKTETGAFYFGRGYEAPAPEVLSEVVDLTGEDLVGIEGEVVDLTSEDEVVDLTEDDMEEWASEVVGVTPKE